MTRYELAKKLSPILSFLGGSHEREPQYYICTTTRPLKRVVERLWGKGYGYNVLSAHFRGEIYTVRKPTGDNRHQYHLRLYKVEGGIEVEGHYETDVLLFPLEHKDGVDLQPLQFQEKSELERLLQ
jgi:hypothetical protein